MEGLIWLVVLCALTTAMLLALSLCRRMLSHEFSEQLVTWVALKESQGLERRLETLASQIVWTDNALMQKVWLVDCTAEGTLEAECMEFCRKHKAFCYCPLSELVKIFGKMGEAEKNDCISSKNHV